MLQKFSRRVAQLYGADDDPSGEDGFLERVADGETIKSIMSDFGYSRGMFYTWVKSGGEKRQEKFMVARTLSADAMVDDGLAILDALQDLTMLSNAEVSAATSRANYRRWLATVRNREEYGEKAGVNVNLTINQLHLDALRRAGHMPVAGNLPEAEVVDQVPGLEAPALPNLTTTE